MDFLELCARRQSCRNFEKRPVEHEKLLKCVEAGRLAPSACNSQPWSFVVAESPEAVEAAVKCGQQLGLNAFLSNAGAVIVILEEHAVLVPKIRPLVDSQYFSKGDLGHAVMLICLEAEAQGLGTCVIGVYDREGLCKALGIPAEKRFAAFIAVGYPADDTVREKIRKPLEDIVRFV